MKKILLGVCGVGNGHINRQRLIINHLLDYDIYIVLAVAQKDYAFFESAYPGIQKVIVMVPRFYMCDIGIDFKAVKETYIAEGIDYYATFLDFSIEVQKAFCGSNPDFVLTDYDPNVAQFAYATNTPLIGLEQHSKFLCMANQRIDDTSADMDNYLLNYFFPKVNKRYAPSFFKIENNREYNIEAIPPVVKDIKRGMVKENKVVVYFSPYSSDSVKYRRILELIKNYTNYTFVIYTELMFGEYDSCENMVFKKISDSFDTDLSDCNFIISTAGHQLISEAINLEIPLYLFPLRTFDQNYCCYVVDSQKLGKKMALCEYEEFNEFIKNVECYRSNMREYKRANWKGQWDQVLFEKLEKELDIKKKMTAKP